MAKQDERNSAVPLGTFASSLAPAPAARSTVQDSNAPREESKAPRSREVRTSAAQHVDGEPERKRVRTLLGVPTPSPEALLTAARSSHPSPPKWQRGVRDQAAAVGEAPELEAVPVAKIELRPNPRLATRRPVPTVPMDPASANISAAIQQMLDEQAAVSMEVDDDLASEQHVPRDLVLEAELIELSDSVPPPALVADELQPTAAAPSAPPPRKSIPVLLPAHIADAQAREQARANDATVRTEMRPERALLDDGLPLALHSDSASSLAPAEVQAKAQRDDAAPAFGFLAVAAIALLGVGGFWLTAGGYQRPSVSVPAATASASLPAAPAAKVAAVAAIAAQPAADIMPPSVSAPVPSAPALLEPLKASPPNAVLAPKPAVALGGLKSVVRSSAKPALASQHVQPSRPSAIDLMPSEPLPVMQVTKVGEASVVGSEAEQDKLPDVPGRDDVLARLEALRGSVKQCAEGRTGVAELDITIAGSGVITTVVVGGDFAGTVQGSCIARAVRQMHFPRFQKERFRLLFPYSI